MEKTFKIATYTGLVEVVAMPVEVAGELCFIFKNGDLWWNVSHAETGMMISEENTKKEALGIAKMRIEAGIEARLSEARRICEMRGFKLPINQ